MPVERRLHQLDKELVPHDGFGQLHDLHVVLNEELGRAEDVHEVRPDQLEGGFALERRVRIVEAHVQRVPLGRVGVILVVLLLGSRGMARGCCGRYGAESTLVQPSTGQQLA